MIASFQEDKFNNNLLPKSLPNKEEYLIDLLNLDHSKSGRLDALYSATFLEEAVQLIGNSIRLYEFGFFDCAFYSLRQSLELSITMIYLVDIEKNKKLQEIYNWESEKKFPMHNQMKQFLDKNGE